MKKYKTEFHVHTRYSKDSILSFWLIKLMCKIKGINTLVICDHNEVSGSLKYKEKFKKYNIEIIVGEEIFTIDGEIIGIGLNKKIEPNLTPKETIKQIKEQNGIVYIPHPYDEKRYKTVLKEEQIKLNKKNIDYIEIHNGRNISKSYDIKQNEIAEKYNLTKIIGSDAHTFFELGRNYILTDNKVTIEELRKKKIKYEFNQKGCIKFAHSWTKVARIIKMVGRGDFNGIYRAINRKCKRKKQGTI